MNEEQQFWYAIWRLVAIVICVIALALAGSCTNRAYQLRALITEAKIDPISASCALDGGDRASVQCTIHGVRR